MSDRPDRVLLMVPQPFFQWRGSPIRVGFNARALAESGYEVDLLVMPVGEDEAIPGVRIHRVPNVLGVKSLPIGPSLAKAILDVFLFFKAWSMARKQRYRVIHAVEEAGILGIWVGRLTGAKVIYEKHSDPASYRKGGLRNLLMGCYAKVERMAAQHADAVIGTGPALVDQVKAIDPRIRAFHISDIPSSLEEANPTAVAKHRASLIRNEDDVVITYVGSFAVYQGIDLMFDAIPRLVKRFPQARCVIVGGSEAEISERKRQLATQGVADAVLFAGKVPPDDLPNLLAASDILLSPRIAGHNTPLKLLDYLKVGRAIVATDHEANRLILDDETAEWSAMDPAALAEAIGKLIADPERRAALGSQGRERIDTCYNYGEFKRKLAECYAGLEAVADS